MFPMFFEGFEKGMYISSEVYTSSIVVLGGIFVFVFSYGLFRFIDYIDRDKD